jgi:lipopolysaccharide transport system permease protein
MQNLTKLLGYKDLLYMLAWRDIRVRYKQSIMGVLWAILMPMLIVGAGALIRFILAEFTKTKVSSEDIASVMVRAVIWAFFMSAIKFGTNSLVSNANLVAKMAFPKEVFPIAAVLSSLFDFAVAAVFTLLVLFLMGAVSGATALWALPLLLVMIVQALGLALLMSSLNLFFRDVKYLVEIVLTYAIFFTPVIFSSDMLGRWEPLLLLNPVAPLIETIADLMIGQPPPALHWIAYSIGWSLVLLLMGYALFKQLEAKFAERI